MQSSSLAVTDADPDRVASSCSYLAGRVRHFARDEPEGTTEVESDESGPHGLPTPEEGGATGILWVGPTTPVYVCDEHATEHAGERFALEETATPEEADAARSEAYRRLVEERPDCEECEDPGTVAGWVR